MYIYRIRSYLREDIKYTEMFVFPFAAIRGLTKLPKCVSPSDISMWVYGYLDSSPFLIFGCLIRLYLSAGNLSPGISGGLSLKIVWHIVDNDCSSNDLLRKKTARIE